MKILYLSHSSEIQGSGRALLNIIKGIQAHNIESIVVVPKRDGALCEELRKMKVNYLIVPLALSVYPSLKTRRDIFLYIPRIGRIIINNTISFFRIIHIIKIIKPDLIHTNVGPIHVGSMAAILTHIPHVWHIREYQDLDFGWNPFPSKRFFFKMIHHPNNHLISITKGVSSYYKMTNKDAIVYDGVINSEEKPEIKDKQNYFLFVGSLDRAKGIEDAIHAFVEIVAKFPLFRLYIAGSGNTFYTEYLSQLVKQSGYTDKINFLGFRSDVDSLMSNAAALIVSSRFEGFGFITTEAMYNGCLVIGKNTAGTKEQFDNGLKYCGKEIGFRYSSYEELVISMALVCKNGANCFLKTIRLAQNSVIALYSIKKNIQEILDLYNKILENNALQV